MVHYSKIASRPNRVRVYIASPYMSNPEQGAQRQVDMWHMLDALGFHPIAPLLMHYMNPQPDAHTCMAHDLQEVRQCDVVLRLPGFSPGAEREVEEARVNGKPVYYSVDDLLAAHGSPFFGMESE